jgi:hypothetical protein
MGAASSKGHAASSAFLIMNPSIEAGGRRDATALQVLYQPPCLSRKFYDF